MTGAFSTPELAEIETFHDAVDILVEKGIIDEERANELNGFPLMPASYKESLIGQPFLIIQAQMMQGKAGTDYVEMVTITTTNVRATVRDSSRGIAEQMRRAIAAQGKGVICGMWVRKGLRYDEYPFDDVATGKRVLTRTYFLDL